MSGTFKPEIVLLPTNVTGESASDHIIPSEEPVKAH